MRPDILAIIALASITAIFLPQVFADISETTSSNQNSAEELLMELKMAEQNLAQLVVYKKTTIPIHSISVDEKEMVLKIGIDINRAELPIHEYENLIRQTIGDVPMSVGFGFFSVNAAPSSEESPLMNMITHVLGKSGSDPDFTISNENFYAVWADAGGVWFRKSFDNGWRLGEPIRIAETNYAHTPKISVSEKNVYVTWIDNDYDDHSKRDVFFAKSQNNGISFEPPVNISKNDLDSPAVSFVDNFIVSSDNGKDIYVTWVIGNYNWAQVYLAKSHDGGDSFGKARNISNTSDDGYPNNPKIAVSGNYVYATWEEASQGNIPPTNIIFIKSSNKGDSFEEPRVFSNSATTPLMSLFVEGADVFVLWFDQEGISLKRSSDQGTTFGYTTILEDGWYPSMSFYKGFVYLTWIEKTGDIENIFFSKSRDGGKTFLTPVQISNHAQRTSPYAELPLPKILAHENNIMIQWTYSTNPIQSWISISNDAGESFANVNLNEIIKDNRILQAEMSKNFLYLSYHNSTTNNIQLNKIHNLNSTTIIDLGSEYVIVEDSVYDFSDKAVFWNVLIAIIIIIITSPIVIVVMIKRRKR